MAPLISKTVDKAKGVKWLFKSVFSDHKAKTGATKKEKGINNEDNVCDAVPDSARKNNTRPSFQSNNKDTDNEQSERYYETYDGEKFEDAKPKNEQSDEEQSNSYANGSKRKQKNFTRQSEGTNTGTNNGEVPCNASQTNIYISNGKNVQVGNSWTSVQYIGFPNPNQPQQPTQRRKTEAIKVILKSKDVVNSAHLECVSRQFGKQWQIIGCKLGFTDIEINNLKKKFVNRNEASYKMLEEWKTKRGENATVGRLCIELWDSKLTNALEAVHQLSIHICNLQ